MIRYACKYCGAVVAEYDLIHRDGEVTFSSWCDEPDCRAQASADFNRSLARAGSVSVTGSPIGTRAGEKGGGAAASPPVFVPGDRVVLAGYRHDFGTDDLTGQVRELLPWGSVVFEPDACWCNLGIASIDCDPSRLTHGGLA